MMNSCFICALVLSVRYIIITTCTDDDTAITLVSYQVSNLDLLNEQDVGINH